MFGDSKHFCVQNVGICRIRIRVRFSKLDQSGAHRVQLAQLTDPTIHKKEHNQQPCRDGRNGQKNLHHQPVEKVTKFCCKTLGIFLVFYLAGFISSQESGSFYLQNYLISSAKSYDYNLIQDQTGQLACSCIYFCKHT